MPKMLSMGAEILRNRKSVLDHLGKSRTLLETLLNFGTAISEVSTYTSCLNVLLNIPSQKGQSCGKSSACFS